MGITAICPMLPRKKRYTGSWINCPHTHLLWVTTPIERSLYPFAARSIHRVIPKSALLSPVSPRLVHSHYDHHRSVGITRRSGDQRMNTRKNRSGSCMKGRNVHPPTYPHVDNRSKTGDNSASLGIRSHGKMGACGREVDNRWSSGRWKRRGPRWVAGATAFLLGEHCAAISPPPGRCVRDQPPRSPHDRDADVAAPPLAIARGSAPG